MDASCLYYASEWKFDMIHAVFFISNTVEFRLVLYLVQVPRFFTSFVTYFVPYFSFKIFDSVALILVSFLKSGG